MNVSFFGRLTKAPEVKTNQTGTSYTTFTVATQVQAKGQDGKAKTLFVDVSAFGKQGDTIVKYFGKGSRIVIHGDIFDANAWVGKNDGQPHIGVNVTMSGFDFVDTQAESAARQQSAPVQPQPPTRHRGHRPRMARRSRGRCRCPRSRHRMATRLDRTKARWTSVLDYINSN